MCIFSGAVKDVSATCIVVGKTKNKNMRIIYTNQVACETGNIMILPVPTEKIKLIELPKKYNDLGKSIIEGYKELIPKPKSKSKKEYAEIMSYGPYDVSITKNLEKVDWNSYGGLKKKKKFYELMNGKYPECSFLIAKIKEKCEKNESKMPITYEFLSNKPKFFLPTFHIHSGIPEEIADWDHIIILLNMKTKFPKKEKLIEESKFKECFKLLNKLLVDSVFKDNPFKKAKNIKIMRIKGKSFPNKDISCKIDSAK